MTGLQFPDRLRSRLVDSSGNSVPGEYAVCLTLQARFKNDYHITKLTEHRGEVVFSRSELEDYIVEQQRLYIMDYSSRLNECWPEVLVKTPSSEEVMVELRALEEFQRITGREHKLIPDLKRARNGVISAVVASIKLTTPVEEVIMTLIVR